jgi:hypothetical protein
MTSVLQCLVVPFTSFCVWLTVRIINRQVRWAKWTAVVLLVVAGLYAESLTRAVADDAARKKEEDVLLQKTLAQVVQRGTQHFDAIKTAHIKFRVSNLGGPFKPGTTPARCSELLKEYDLEQHPDDLGKLIDELVDEDERRARPWSEGELHVAGGMIRESLHFSEQAPDLHISDGQIALRWDEANSQVNIDPAGQSRRHLTGLHDFWSPLRAVPAAKPDGPGIGRIGGQITFIFAENAQGNSGERVVDEASGFLLSTILRQRAAGVVQQCYWLGWNRASGGIPYPAVVVQFDYRGGQLAHCNFRIVNEMRLNGPLPASVFQMGAPAGSAIFDSRNNATISAGRINHDVFDVTSAEQLVEAAKPLDPEPKTPQEKFAVAELRRLYALGDDEVLKRIGPPYPASRKHLDMLLGERYAPARRNIRSDLIAWTNGNFAGSNPYTGASYRFEMLITYLLKLKPTELEGDLELLKREIPGDFVYRTDASSDRLAAGLADIAGLEFQKQIRLVFRDVERPVYIARGELKLAVPPSQQIIAVNGGRHSGAHGEAIGNGNLERLLQEVATYIQTRVINETQPSSSQLTWSSRWYDLPSTPPEKRFELDPQVVLKQITDQCGITFIKEKRNVRVLFVEHEDSP